MITEEDAIKLLEELLSFNDYSRITNEIKRIKSDIFKNNNIKNYFNELLANMYNYQNAEYLKNLLREFLSKVEEEKNKIIFKKCSFSDVFVAKLRNCQEIIRDKVLNKIEIIDSGNGKKQSKEIGKSGIYEIPHKVHYPIRVFWYEKEGIYYVVDFYHKNEVDPYYDKLSKGIVTRESYGNWKYL